MKKYKFISFLFMLVACVFSLASCGAKNVYNVNEDVVVSEKYIFKVSNVEYLDSVNEIITDENGNYVNYGKTNSDGDSLKYIKITITSNVKEGVSEEELKSANISWFKVTPKAKDVLVLSGSIGVIKDYTWFGKNIFNGNSIDLYFQILEKDIEKYKFLEIDLETMKMDAVFIKIVE